MSESISYPLSLHKPEKLHTKRHKPLPVHWQPPPSLFPRLVFHTICFLLTFHSNLDFMWEVFKDPKGWKNFHIQYLAQLNQLSTVVCLRDSFAALSHLLIDFDSKD